MRIIISVFLIVIYISGNAQKVVISGHILNKEGTTNQWRLVNHQLGVDLPIEIGNDGYFTITVPSLIKGFYDLGSAGILYVEPGYRLHLEPLDDSRYAFTGKGRKENTILSKIQWEDKNILALNDGGPITFQWKVLNAPIDTFLALIQQYQSLVRTSCAISKNRYFVDLTQAHFTAFSLNLLPPFEKEYGSDQQRYNEYLDIKKGSDKDTFYVKRVHRYRLRVKKKILRIAERERIDSIYTSNIDWNNESLFDNSIEYQKRLIMLSEMLAKKYASTTEDIEKIKIDLVQRQITSQKIQAFVLSHLHSAKD